MRQAECRCGQLKAQCEGEPVLVAVCHCLVCQRRTGSALGVQARFPADQVTVTGEWSTYTRISETGRTASYRFCPTCGNTVIIENEGSPGLVTLPVGAFADPDFPAPSWSFFEGRKFPWLSVAGDNIKHLEEGYKPRATSAPQAEKPA